MTIMQMGIVACLGWKKSPGRSAVKPRKDLPETVLSRRGCLRAMAKWSFSECSNIKKMVPSKRARRTEKLSVGIVGVLGTGVPRLACLRPAAWLKGRPSTAHLHQHRPKTLARGQASRGGRHGASSGTASSGWLARRRRDQGGVPHEVPVTQAMMTKGARRAPAT